MAVQVRRFVCPVIEGVPTNITEDVPITRTTWVVPGPTGPNVFVAGEWTLTVERTFAFVTYASLPETLTGTEVVVGPVFDTNYEVAHVCMDRP